LFRSVRNRIWRTGQVSLQHDLKPLVRSVRNRIWHSGQVSPNQDLALWLGQSATGFRTLVRPVRTRIWHFSVSPQQDLALRQASPQQDLAHSGQVSPQHELAL
jgi:hypothetical protein